MGQKFSGETFETMGQARRAGWQAARSGAARVPPAVHTAEWLAGYDGYGRDVDGIKDALVRRHKARIATARKPGRMVSPC